VIRAANLIAITSGVCISFKTMPGAHSLTFTGEVFITLAPLVFTHFRNRLHNDINALVLDSIVVLTIAFMERLDSMVVAFSRTFWNSCGGSHADAFFDRTMQRISENAIVAIDCARRFPPFSPGGAFSILDLAVALSFGRTFPSMLVCHHKLRNLLPFDILPLGEGVWRALGQGVHLRAALVACMVHLISPNVDAILFATMFKQLLLGGACHEHINVAFNLLSGRPINLAICFQALFLWIILADLNLTATPTLLVADLAVQEVAGVPLAIAGLALGLLAVTFGILLNVAAVGGSASLVKAFPLLVN
jgi:hypothetical protein